MSITIPPSSPLSGAAIVASLKDAAKKNDAKKVSLAALATPQDPEKARKQAEAQNTMRQVLQTIQQNKADLPKQRKAAAQAKVIQIRAQIDALKLSSLVDPKMVARMAARLAKELAAAVKEYRSAGGTESIAVSAPPVTASSEISETEAATTHVETETEAPVKGDANFQTYEKRQEDGEKPSSNPAAQQKEDDSPFINSVKEALEELKKLVRKQKYASLLQITPSGKRDQVAERKAEDALREAERALSSLQQHGGMAISTASLNIQT